MRFLYVFGFALSLLIFPQVSHAEQVGSKLYWNCIMGCRNPVNEDAMFACQRRCDEWYGQNRKDKDKEKNGKVEKDSRDDKSVVQEYKDAPSDSKQDAGTNSH